MLGLATLARVGAARTVYGRNSRALRNRLSSARRPPEHLAKNVCAHCAIKNGLH